MAILIVTIDFCGDVSSITLADIFETQRGLEHVFEASAVGDATQIADVYSAGYGVAAEFPAPSQVRLFAGAVGEGTDAEKQGNN